MLKDKNFLELAKYLIVGVINTFVGFGLTLLLTYLDVLPEAANFAGWVFGTAVSFVLNSVFTFKQKPTWRAYFKFILSMSLAFFINIAVLRICYVWLGLNVYLSQLIAAVFYTLSGFLLSKFFAFKKR